MHLTVYLTTNSDSSFQLFTLKAYLVSALSNSKIQIYASNDIKICTNISGELCRPRFLDVDIVGCRNWTWIHYLAEFNFILLGDQMLGEIGCHPEICFYLSKLYLLVTSMTGHMANNWWQLRVPRRSHALTVFAACLQAADKLKLYTLPL